MHRRLKKAVLNFPREFAKITLPLTSFRNCRNSPTRITSAMRQAYTYLVAQKFGSKTDSKMARNEGFCDHIAMLCNCFAYVAHAYSKSLSARKSLYLICGTYDFDNKNADISFTNL